MLDLSVFKKPKPAQPAAGQAVAGQAPAKAPLEPGMIGAGAVNAGTAAAVIDATDASFMADVVEASRTQPVIVDFWAPWCGPCKQLTPILERVVAASKGAVRLVKVNIDENPRIAAQLRVQSIPTVYAFDNGQPIDGFQGALPESQVKAFIERLAGPAGPSDVDELLALATESLEVGDMGGAAQAYAQALSVEPENVKAIAGLARCYLQGGDPDRARDVLAMASADAKDAALDSVRAALTLAQGANAETAALDRRLATDPDDHEARFELAKAKAARGDFPAAIDQLLAIMTKDRDWREGAARAQLLTVFEAAGAGSEAARSGRRRLSSLLFS